MAAAQHREHAANKGIDATAIAASPEPTCVSARFTSAFDNTP
jgi:hypothetical protein